MNKEFGVRAYLRKPELAEAVQVSSRSREAAAAWLEYHGKYARICKEDGELIVFADTLVPGIGEKPNRGDWIVRTSQGLFAIMEDREFRSLWTPVPGKTGYRLARLDRLSIPSELAALKALKEDL
jgi:hypothetical protein